MRLNLQCIRNKLSPKVIRLQATFLTEKSGAEGTLLC